METKTKINYLALAAIFIIVIFYLAADYNKETPDFKKVNNAPAGKNQEPEISPVLAISPTITPDPSIVSATSPILKPLSCNEISLGNKERKEIALTFDAGAGIGSADKILEILKENNIKASFFLTGKWAEQNSELVKKIAGAGHEIYNHTYSHPDLTKIAEEEIKNQLEQTENVIKNLTGKSTKPFFRPPYGARNKTILDFICREEYQAVMWTVDALDWKEGTTAETAKDRIFAKEQNGEIILMHVGDNLSAEILPEVIRKFGGDGYKLATLSEIIRE